METIEITINPLNEKWCGGKCPMKLSAAFGTISYCRIFSEQFDELNQLEINENGCVLRHQKCIKLSKKNI